MAKRTYSKIPSYALKNEYYIDHMSDRKRIGEDELGCLASLFGGVLIWILLRILFWIPLVFATIASIILLIVFFISFLAWRRKRFLKSLEGETWFVYTPRRSSREFLEGKVFPRLIGVVRPVFLPHGRLEWTSLDFGRELSENEKLNFQLTHTGMKFPRISIFRNGHFKECSINKIVYETINGKCSVDEFVIKIQEVILQLHRSIDIQSKPN